jgi:hypothetical protein
MAFVDRTDKFFDFFKDRLVLHPRRSLKLALKFRDKNAYKIGLIPDWAYMIRKVMGVNRELKTLPASYSFPQYCQIFLTCNGI